jgi:hypothetical protein
MTHLRNRVMKIPRPARDDSPVDPLTAHRSPLTGYRSPLTAYLQ